MGAGSIFYQSDDKPKISRTKARPLLRKTGSPIIQYYDYNIDQITCGSVRNFQDLEEPPAWFNVRWINIEGIDEDTVNSAAARYNIHPLVVEDILDVPERVKVDYYNNFNTVFVTAKMVKESEDDKLSQEYVFMFLTQDVLITFQEGKPGDVFGAVRKALEKPHSRVRSNDASFLLYALLDAITDNCYPVVQRFGEDLEDIELKMIDEPTGQLNRRVYSLKRELLLLRRSLSPMEGVLRSLLHELTDDSSHSPRSGRNAASFQEYPIPQGSPTQARSDDLITAVTKTYLRDVLDHALHLVDVIDIYRETCNELSGLYSSRQSYKMNSVMYILTLVSTIFIPLTFLAGVYGMNFDNMPELHWKYGYAYCWATFVAIAGFVMFIFYRHNILALSPD
eukprot:GILK01013263.1.p1 GENE.GILK01013263.1~~GILK01013263.1.p1  ORF type:complete len:394 (+),score=64.46 GILK01013263.1:101-1282(+)